MKRRDRKGRLTCAMFSSLLQQFHDVKDQWCDFSEQWASYVCSRHRRLRLSPAHVFPF